MKILRRDVNDRDESIRKSGKDEEKERW